MTYKTLLQEALRDIPEFKKEYEKEIKIDLIDKDSGLHIVFGYAFAPLLMKAIKNNNTILVKKMFDFMEKMSASNDRLVMEVCDFSILEALCDNFTEQEILQFMGSKTLEGYREIKKYMQ